MAVVVLMVVVAALFWVVCKELADDVSQEIVLWVLLCGITNVTRLCVCADKQGEINSM